MQHDGEGEGRLSGNGLLSHRSNFCHTEPNHLFLCVVRLSSLLVTSFYIILWFSWAVVFTPCSSHFLLDSYLALNNNIFKKRPLVPFSYLWTFIDCLCLIPSLHVFVHFQAKLIQEFSSVAQSDSLWPHGLKHARPPCPSPTPGDYSNSCPLSQWCHPTNLILCRPLLLLPSVFPSIRVR